jgi:phosphoribosylanthranilate isomerase
LSRTRIKFCGIRSAKDAQAAVALGVDAIGFVLVPGSPRALTAEKAASIRRRLPPFVSAVALFKDADSAAVQDAIDALCPDLLQFHGNEDAAYCASFGLSYLKAVAMGEGGTFKAEARRHRAASGLLLDSHVRGGMGGRGETFDWRAAQAAIAGTAVPLILAGGLNAANVGKGMAALRPFAVDVSSGIEARPGVKDHDKMRAFVAAVRRADEKLK